MLLHIGAFHLDIDSQGASVWHRLTPRNRVICSLLFVLATALTPNGHWWTWVVYGSGLALLLFLTEITLPVLLKRVAIESSFLVVVLIGALFRSDGIVLWHWGWLRVTDVGLMVLGSVTLKAMLCLLMLNLLVLTTAIPALLHALVALRMPPLLVAIFAAMYRYIYVLLEEFSTMRRAAASRNLMGSNRHQRLVVGNMIGSLFVRTYDRGDRVHQAMLSRGYTGLPPIMEIPQEKQIDKRFLALVFSLILFGQFISWHF
jgi:cobalt/nickel transport system permease protein